MDSNGGADDGTCNAIRVKRVGKHAVRGANAEPCKNSWFSEIEYEKYAVMASPK
jgi:hypothetical protein